MARPDHKGKGDSFWSAAAWCRFSKGGTAYQNCKAVPGASHSKGMAIDYSLQYVNNP